MSVYIARNDVAIHTARSKQLLWTLPQNTDMLPKPRTLLTRLQH